LVETFACDCASNGQQIYSSLREPNADITLFLHVTTVESDTLNKSEISVLKNSELWEHGDNACRTNHIIGDGAYSIKEWLLTPYRDTGHLNAEQGRYNYIINKIFTGVSKQYTKALKNTPCSNNVTGSLHVFHFNKLQPSYCSFWIFLAFT
jgi:hypothetical protein